MKIKEYEKIIDFLGEIYPDQLKRISTALEELESELVSTEEFLINEQQNKLSAKEYDKGKEIIEIIEKLNTYEEKLDNVLIKIRDMKGIELQETEIKTSKNNSIDFSWEDIADEDNKVLTLINITKAMMKYKEIDKWEGPPGKFREEISNFVMDEFDVDLNEFGNSMLSPAWVGRRLKKAKNNGLMEERGLMYERVRHNESSTGCEKYEFVLAD